jgi:hypothetical protein
MIAQDPRGQSPLVTFRLDTRLDALAEGGHLRAERAPDHRPAYLSYEGPISGDRGRVRRLAAGLVTDQRRGPDLWDLEVHWHGGPAQRLRLRRQDGETWRIEVAAQGGPEGAAVVPEVQGD